jgi:Zn-dependent protease with chaperone function
MFALRGVAVSVSVFVLLYCGLSAMVCLSWRRLYRSIRHHRMHRIADWLFALRMLPLGASVVITLACTVPSFLMFEPRVIEEPVRDLPLALGLVGTALVILGVTKAIVALFRTSRTISHWTNEAELLDLVNAVPVLRIRPAVPAMTAAGILKQRILLSRSAEFLLSPRELQSAFNHELAHVRRRDNLKKLLLRFVAFPGMGSLEMVWLEATEMAADDEAVSNAVEALDLAAALIKLSRFASAQRAADLTVTLVYSPVSTVNARVERLISWSAQVPLPAVSRKYFWASAGTILLAFAFTYSHLLAGIHQATEWLMR